MLSSWIHQPLLILPDWRKRYIATLEGMQWPSEEEVASARQERLEEARAAAGKARGQYIRGRGRLGVIGVFGPITQRLDLVGFLLGGTSCEEISAALDALLADKGVDAIL